MGGGKGGRPFKECIQEGKERVINSGKVRMRVGEFVQGEQGETHREGIFVLQKDTAKDKASGRLKGRGKRISERTGFRWKGVQVLH